MRPEELKSKMKGVVAVLITPFHDNYEVDYEGLARNVKFQIEQNVDVIVVGGSTGEFSSLSFEEFKQCVKVGVEAVGGKVPVLAGSSHSGTHECIRLSQASEEVGADGLLIVPPYYLKPAWQGVLEHYKMIADNVKIGISIYNNPGFSKVNILPNQLLEMVEKVDRVVAVKDTGGDMTQFAENMRLVGDRIAVLMGREILAFSGLAYGAPGYVSSMANFAPGLAIELYQAFQKKDLDWARATEQKIAPYNALQAELLQRLAFPAQIPMVKEAMNMLGMAAGPVRPPLTRLSPEIREKLKGILSDWGLL